METNYDVIIIGGGPAGLTAGLYTARDNLKTLIIEKAFFGGQIATTELVENFPGFPDGISGYDLGQLIYKQAVKYNLAAINAEVTGVEVAGKEKTVMTTEGKFNARAIIITAGSERAKLEVPGEQEFTGKGVSYCATCDGAFFRDMDIAVVGGGNAAVAEAIHLTSFARKVYLIHRRDQLRATAIVQEKATSNPKISFVWNTVVDSVEGTGSVKQLKLHNVKTGEKSTLDVSGVFVSTGLKPNSGFLQGIVPLDAAGKVITDDRMQTSIAGVFAAGDIRANSGMQAIIAAGEGATAAVYARKYLAEE